MTMMCSKSLLLEFIYFIDVAKLEYLVNDPYNDNIMLVQFVLTVRGVSTAGPH